MHRLTNSQLQEMMQMQNALNARVDPNWLTANHAWHRAIRVECAELTEHLGWKWWKKQEPNWPQAQIEVVDIWHFMLSHMLVAAEGDVPAAVAYLHDSLDFPKMEVIQILDKRFTVSGLTLHQQVDTLSAFASLGHVFVALFESVMVGTGLTWDQLRSLYLAKNVLNMFRQNNGYAQGTYQKEWFGAEDNVFIERVMVTTPDITAEALYAELGKAYEAVTQPAAA